MTFKELKRGVRDALSQRRPLPRLLDDAVDRIQAHGNLVAHAASRHDAVTYRSLGEEESILLPWVGPEEAWKDLQDATSIIRHLARAVKSP